MADRMKQHSVILNAAAQLAVSWVDGQVPIWRLRRSSLPSTSQFLPASSAPLSLPSSSAPPPPVPWAKDTFETVDLVADWPVL
jgi:hypothetical protein